MRAVGPPDRDHERGPAAELPCRRLGRQDGKAVECRALLPQPVVRECEGFDAVPAQSREGAAAEAAGPRQYDVASAGQPFELVQLRRAHPSRVAR